jgi:beta-lactamase regulating signal transducer with metallopeptidase domain
MSSNLLTTSPGWTAASWTMLHVIWIGAAIGLLAALVRRLLKSARPETRYGVALVFLLALAVAPVVIFLRILEPVPEPPVTMVHSASDTSASVALYTSSELSPTTRQASRDVALDRRVGGPTGSPLDSLVALLPWIWLCGSLSTLFMLATGLIGVEQMRRSSRLVESGDLPQRCRALANSLGIARRVSVGICDRLAMPVLVGIVRPLILLPPAALNGWSVEQLEMVLLHELAHVRRWDNLVNLIQRLVESMLFFHPVVWWLSGWVRLERELCCDRLVVERLGHPVAYAEMLVSLAGTRNRGSGAMLAMADRQVMTRIRRLLDQEDRSMKLSMPEGLGLLGAIVVGVLFALRLQAAPPLLGSDSNEMTQLVQGKAPDGINDVPVRHAMPARVISGDTSSTAGLSATRDLKPVPPSGKRATSLFPRTAQRLEITQLPRAVEGVVTCVCRGGIRIVSKSPKFGTVSMEADEAVIVRNLYRRKGDTLAGPNGESWVEEDELPMAAHLKGDVIFRQDQYKFAGMGDTRTVRARELNYDFVADRLLALNAELEVAAPGLAKPFKTVSSRIEQFHPVVRRPDGSIAPSEHREIRAGEDAKLVGPPNPSAKTRDPNRLEP